MSADLQTVLARILEAMQQGAAEYGPKALNMALEVQRWGSAGRLAVGVVLLAFTVWAAPRAVKTFWKELARFNDEGDFYEMPVIPVLWGAGSAIALVSTGWMAAERLLNLWNWVGLVRPDLAFAYGLMQRVLQ